MCPAVFHLSFDRKSVDRTSFLSLQPGLFKLPMMLAFDYDFMHRITVLACLRYQQPSNHPLSLSHFFFSQFGLSTLKFMFLSKKYIMNHLKRQTKISFYFSSFFHLYFYSRSFDLHQSPSRAPNIELALKLESNLTPRNQSNCKRTRRSWWSESH